MLALAAGVSVALGTTGCATSLHGLEFHNDNRMKITTPHENELVSAPFTLSWSALVGIMPFVGVLGIAALGQHIVIQQRGFDLSAAGNMSLTAVILCNGLANDASPAIVILSVVAVTALGGVIGLVNGLFVSSLRVPPIVTTIGVNVILLGGYVFGCHAFRHLIGGTFDRISEHPMRHKLYDCVSCLNARHQKWAWASLFWVGFSDIYVRLCSMGIWHDWRIL